MKSGRFEQLSDGIFAIVMTVLVFELKIPALSDTMTNAELLRTLANMTPIFLSYILAFAMLFTYWRAHHFFISVYAKNIDMTLTNINAFFFLFVGIVPFSTSLLGKQSLLQVPVIIFSVNVIAIGLCLYTMREYVFRSPSIKNIEVEHEEILRGTIRTLVPVFFALLAIPLCFYSNTLALTLLTLAILFNFSSNGTRLIAKIFH